MDGSALTSRFPWLDSRKFWGWFVFLFAISIRFVGIGWGLPDEKHFQSYHPDEPVVYAYSQQIEPTSLDFSPSFYNYGTLYLTVLRVASDIVRSYGGSEPSNAYEAGQQIRNVHLAGRLVSVISGAGTAWLVFLILVNRTNLFGAILGGTMMALASGHVMHSRFQTVDVLAAFLMMASLAVCLSPIEDEGGSRSLRWIALAGFLGGLSAGTKYIGFLMVIPVIFVTASTPRINRAQAMFYGLFALAIGFFMATPGALFDSAKFAEDFKYEMVHTSTGHGLVFAGTSMGYIYHIANLSAGFGSVATLLGGGGLLAIVLRKHRWGWAVLILAVMIYILIGRAEVKFFRYVIPLIPLLSIGFGWLVGQAHSNPNPKWKVVVVSAILAIGFAARDVVVQMLWMTCPDPRDEAAAYVKSQADDSTAVGLVSDPWFYTPPYYPYTALSRMVPNEVRDELMAAARFPRVARYIEPGGTRHDWDVRLIDELKPEFVTISSFETEGLERLSEQSSATGIFAPQVEQYKQFLVKLRNDYEPIKLFGADAPLIHDLMYVRPKIVVWKRRAN